MCTVWYRSGGEQNHNTVSLTNYYAVAAADDDNGDGMIVALNARATQQCYERAA